jgi:tetraacyldisaccharide 4'-kinase
MLSANPLSWVYPWGAFFHRSLYRWGVCDTQTLQKPVLSVGNITSGGTGKTPLVIKLAEDLRNAGRTPAILTRGYKRPEPGTEPLVLLHNDHPVTETGDEAFLLSQHLPNIPVVISADRSRAGKSILEGNRMDCLILDDGFQHWPLTRDIDIVCVDALAPFGGGWGQFHCFLREWPSALKRASLIVITKTNLIDPEKMNILKNQLHHLSPEAPLVESIYEPTLTTPDGQTSPNNLSGQKVIALSGIGSPLAFERMLTRLGAVEVTSARFPDHHFFTAQELDSIFECAWRGGFIVVATEKDAVRVPRSYPVHTLVISVKFVYGEEDWRAVIQRPWGS